MQKHPQNYSVSSFLPPFPAQGAEVIQTLSQVPVPPSLRAQNPPSAQKSLSAADTGDPWNKILLFCFSQLIQFSLLPPWLSLFWPWPARCHIPEGWQGQRGATAAASRAALAAAPSCGSAQHPSCSFLSLQRQPRGGRAAARHPLTRGSPGRAGAAGQEGRRVPQGWGSPGMDHGSHRSRPRSYRGKSSWAIFAGSEHWHCSTRCFSLSS